MISSSYFFFFYPISSLVEWIRVWRRGARGGVTGHGKSSFLTFAGELNVRALQVWNKRESQRSLPFSKMSCQRCNAFNTGWPLFSASVSSPSYAPFPLRRILSGLMLCVKIKKLIAALFHLFCRSENGLFPPQIKRTSLVLFAENKMTSGTAGGWVGRSGEFGYGFPRCIYSFIQWGN